MMGVEFRLAVLGLVCTSTVSCTHRMGMTRPPALGWAEELARRDRRELDYRPPRAQVGCFRVRLGPDYLPNASTGTRHLFIPNPGVVELSSEWTTDRINSGLRVRTPPRSTPWRDGGVWWPTMDGGATIRLGDGFSGMNLVVHPQGSLYAGKAATYRDVGYDSQRAGAELWPAPCVAAQPAAAADGASLHR